MTNAPRSITSPFHDGTSTTTTSRTAPKLRLDDLQATVEKLRGMPPVKWMLISPEGHVWSDEDPMVLASILAQRKFGLPGFGSGALGDGGSGT